MKPTKFLFFLVVAALIAASCGSNLQKGTQAYNQMQYDKSNYFLKKALDEKKDDAKTLRMLANGYQLTNQTRKAEYVYAKLIKGSKTAKDATPEDYLNYGKMLMANENYAGAKQAFHEYDSLMEFKSDLAKYMILSCDSVSMFHQDTAMYNVNETAIRGIGERFGATPSGNGIIICGEVQSIDQNAKQRFPWLGPGNLDLYYTEKESTVGTGDYIKPTPLKGDVNSLAHEGPCAISPDGNMMYFSRSTVVEKIDPKTKKVVKAESVLKIYSAQKADEQWVNPQPLSFCSDEYSVMNPALMPDGKTMIFASDKPGGMGGSDLYTSTLKENGDWTEPQNMGANINSTGNEVFPFVSKDSMLYFSTDGRYTLGGLDVYESEWDGSSFSTAENLNIPVNTSHDDFCFTTSPYLDDDKAKGWVSSNKSGHERIYEWTRQDPVLYLEGTVVDRSSRKPVVNARVEIINGDGNKITISTDEKGKFYYDKLLCRSSYTIKAGKEKYKVSRASLTTKKEKRRKGYIMNFALETIGSNVLVRNIYFAFGSFAISSESAKTLDTLAKKLKAEVNIDVEVGAHTDSRGSARFNKWLSERRAKSTVEYLVKRGVSRDRLAGKGYGESKPVNSCYDGVKCSDAQYAANRRIEFKIIKLRTDAQKSIDAAKDANSNNAGKVIVQPK